MSYLKKSRFHSTAVLYRLDLAFMSSEEGARISDFYILSRFIYLELLYIDI